VAKEPATTASASGKNETARESPAGTPALYSAPMPLDSRRHGAVGLGENFGLSFAARVSAVPVNLVEMPHICHWKGRLRPTFKADYEADLHRDKYTH